MDFVGVFPNTLQMGGVVGAVIMLNGMRQQGCRQFLEGTELFGHSRYYQKSVGNLLVA